MTSGRHIVRVIDRAGTEAMRYHCAAWQVDDVVYFARQQWPRCFVISNDENEEGPQE